MALVARGFGWGIALAFFRQDMDQHRPGCPRLYRAQDRQKLVQIMPVNRADIGKPQRFKEGAAHCHAFQHVLGPLRTFLQRRRQQPEEALGHLFQVLHRRFGVKPRQIGRQRPHRRGDAHLVVVQDHEQPLAQMAGVVHRLERHTRAHRPVADHRDGIAGIAAQIGGHRKAQRGTDRGRGMRRAERVIRAFRPFGETRKPAFRPQRANPVPPPGEYLVRIALVAHVPDQLVTRGIKDGVDRHRKFHHPKARAKMTAGGGHGRNRFGAQLSRKLVQLTVTKRLQVRGKGHAVQHRGIGSVGHACLGSISCRAQ